MNLMDTHTPWKIRCSATNREGGQCGKWAMIGQSVCRNHGGASPQALGAARDRLATLVHPAISRLTDLLGSEDERIALQAVRMILDRSTDEHGDPLGAPMPSAQQIARWIEELEAEANQ